MHLLKKFTALLASAVLAMSSAAFTAFTADAAVTEENEATVSFDLSESGVSVEKDQYGHDQFIHEITGTPGSSHRLSFLKLVRSGYTFIGWTFDGVKGYAPGEVIQIPDEDATLKPVWSKNSDSTKYTARFHAVADGVEIDKSGRLPDTKYKPGELVPVPIDVVTHPTYAQSQMGWLYDGVVYRGNENVIMPNKDIEFTPNWCTIHTLRYYGGDVDRLPGIKEQFLDRIANISTDLAESSRILRIGFYNTGWLCSYDGKFYEPESEFMMPDEDVTFTAVWEPVCYNVVFRPDLINKDAYIKIPGYTDTTIICPDINVSKPGYKFAGWDYKGTIYQPGDEFFIYGELTGLGIPLEAVWEEDTAEEVTMYGDANCDEEVTISDSVCIMQTLVNKDKYGVGGSDPDAITAQGYLNADCYNVGDGITSMDALAVQKLCLELVDSLPVSSDDFGA